MKAHTLCPLSGLLAFAFILGPVPARGEAPVGPDTGVTVAMECEEDVLLFDVDPSRLQEHVPKEHEILVGDEGTGLLLVVVQHPRSVRYDGKEAGSSGFMRIWIQVRGPAGQNEVPGADWTLPRLYWYSLFEGASNPQALEHQTAAGLVTRPLSKVDLGLLDSRNQSFALEPDGRGVTWRQAQPEKDVEVQKVGVDHVVHSRDLEGQPRVARVSALATAHRFLVSGTATVDEGTRLAELLGRSGEIAIRLHQFTPIEIEARLNAGE